MGIVRLRMRVVFFFSIGFVLVEISMNSNIKLVVLRLSKIIMVVNVLKKLVIICWKKFFMWFGCVLIFGGFCG